MAPKIFLAGLLTAGACLAQDWVIGGGLGYGAYRNGTITSRIASLTTRSQWKPLFDFGAGVKMRIADHVVVCGDFRDYLSGFPDRLFSPVAGATRHGMLQQFTPTFSVGCSF